MDRKVNYIVSVYNGVLNLDDENNNWTIAYNFIHKGSRVLDVGCSKGAFGEALIKLKHCKVDGLEPDPGDAVLAKKVLNRVITTDIETALTKDLRNEKYDYIVFLDVIEHLYDPSSVMRKLKKHLNANGRIVFSIPNMSHTSVRIMLMGGDFTYGQSGLLDNTHLHYYTRDEINRVFLESGFIIDDIRRSYVAYNGDLIKKQLADVGVKHLDDELIELLLSNDGEVFQFIGTAAVNRSRVSRKLLPRPLSSPNPKGVILAYNSESLTQLTHTMQDKINEISKRNTDILNSTSYKFGNKLLLLPKKIKNLPNNINHKRQHIVTEEGVTIIVPVYADWPSLKECISSLKKYISENTTVLLVNDCGPDADKIERNIQKAINSHENFVYHRNSNNLGFVKTVNKAVYKLDKSDNDILLLNSDTKVTEGFLQAMVNVINRSTNIASVTPRSNRATVFSIPFAAALDEKYPQDKSYELFKKVKDRLPEFYETPTTHGFCMLIRRSVIKKYGLFDEIYSKGYGEENDFCMRVRKKGYTHAVANHSFVFHLGSRSFTREQREKRVAKNHKILISRYPQYDELVDRYVQREVMPEQKLFSE